MFNAVGLRDDQELSRLLAESKARVAAMTPAELEEMHLQQRESWVRAETGLPREHR